MIIRLLFALLLSALSTLASAQVMSNFQDELTDPTSCPNNVLIARAGQHCRDLDDGTDWFCLTPSPGGASPLFCDIPGEWQRTLGTILATGVVNTPAGNIAATTVQAALNELDSEKQPLDADLTTLAAKTVVGSGTDVRMSSGAFVDNECVKVVSGNFVTAGAPCGSGGGGVTNGDKGDITASQTTTPGDTWTIDNNVVTNAKLADMAASTLKGRVTAGTGDPEDLSGAQVTGLLSLFNAGAQGVVPASGGGTVNFLRADGAWQPPPGGAGGTVDVDSVSAATSCVTGGGTDAYACSLSPAISAYATNTRYWVKANVLNTGGATLALNGLTIKTIMKLVNGVKTALATGDVQAAQWMALAYDGTDMILLNPTIYLQNAYDLAGTNTNVDANSNGIKFRNLTSSTQGFYWCGDTSCTTYMRRYYDAANTRWVTETAPVADAITTLASTKSFVVEQADLDDILKITEAGVISAEAAGSVDFSAALLTKPCKQGTTPPTGLGQNECFIDTDNPASSRFLISTSAGVWTPQGAGSAPGGSSGQMQYNNAGALAGITGATADGTTVTLTNPILTTPSLTSPTSSNPTFSGAITLPAVTTGTGNGWIQRTGGINAFGLTSTNKVLLNAPNVSGGSFDFITGGDTTSPVLLTLTKDGVLTLDPANAAGLTPQVDFSLADSVKLFPSQAGAAPTVDNDFRWDPTAHRLKAGENGTGRTVAWTSELGPIPLIAADCSAATIPGGGTCYQSGATPVFFFCPTSVACDTPGEAISLPTADAQDLDNVYAKSGATPGITLGTAGLALKNAASQASAFRVCKGDCVSSTADRWEVYFHPTNGLTIQATPAINTTFEIAATKAMIWNTNAQEFMRLDEATRAILYGPNNLAYQPILWSPMNVDVDGTNCTAATSETVNSSEKLKNFTCTTGGKFSGQFVMPAAYNAGSNLNFRIRYRTLGTTSAVAAFDITAWCRGDGDTVDGSYTGGTAVTGTCSITTGTTANVIKVCNANFTPNGSCTGEDLVSWRAVVAASNTATASNGKLLGGSIRWPRGKDRE